MKRYKRKLKIRERMIPKEEAYWISPRGEILPFSSFSRHIGEIIKNPEMFGYTLDELQSIFTQEGEHFGQEGQARERIIKDLFKKGWIRIRKYTKPIERWTVNVPRLTNKIKDILQYWATAVIKAGFSKYDDVFVDYPQGAKQYTLDDIASDILYTESNNRIPNQRYNVTVLKKLLKD